MRFISLYLLALCLSPVGVYAGTTFNLGVASPFAAFSGSTVTNTGPTNVFGDVGVWQGNAISGFAPGSITGGTTHAGDSVAVQAYSALTTAFGTAANTPCGTNLSGQNLGGLTLTPGVYCFSSSAFLGGTLTLDAKGDPNAVFIFQMTNALTTGMDSSVVLANGGQGSGVIWEVGTSANLGFSTTFAGEILAQGSITLNPGASIDCGGALSINGNINLDSNDISVCGLLAADPADVPEPSTASLLFLIGLPGLLCLHKLRPAVLAAHDRGL
jgi:hypothetical protein